jgi:hypothetical protein
LITMVILRNRKKAVADMRSAASSEECRSSGGAGGEK